MGYKSRGGWSIPVCLRDCCNRDIDCEECFKFSCFEPNVKRMSENEDFGRAQNGQKHGV
jgi:hypothetical protein